MKKILVALDGSEKQADVLDAAVALARKTGAALVLLRAIGVPVDLPAEALSVPPERVLDLLEQRAYSELEAQRARVPSNIAASSQVVVGTAWQAIDDAARNEDVDLIVVGSHGYGGIDRLLGTTAAKVVNHADRSVLVVRAAKRITGG